MSGIEMSLWLVGELYGGEVAERTKSYIAYDFPLRTFARALFCWWVAGLPAAGG